MALEERRVKSAMDRAERKLVEARYHERQAAAARAAAEQLARVWGFKVSEVDPSAKE